MCECIPCMWVSGEARGRWQVLWNLESSSGPPEEPDTLALHCRTSLRPPTVCFLFLNVILINCFKVLYMYTIYFGHFSPHPSLKLIPDPLLLPPNFVYSLFLKTIVHWLQCLVPIYSRMWTIHWSMANSKSHTPLKKKKLFFPRGAWQWLLNQRWRTREPSWDSDWFDLVQVLWREQPLLWVSWCPEDTVLLQSSLTSGFISFSIPSSTMVPGLVGSGCATESPSVAEHSLNTYAGYPTHLWVSSLATIHCTDTLIWCSLRVHWCVSIETLLEK